MEKNLSFYRGRPLVVMAVFYGIGIIIGKNLIPNWLWIAGLVLGASITLIASLLQRSRFFSVSMTVLFLGICLSSWSFHPVLPASGIYWVEGEVADMPTEREDDRFAVPLKNLLLDGEKTKGKAYWTYQWYEKEGQQINIGDRVKFQGNLYHPMKQGNPFGFDFFTHLSKNGMTIGIYGATSLEIKERNVQGIESWLYKTRRAFHLRFEELMGQSAPLASAMVLGQKNQLEESIQEDFATIGIGHVLAISGLHIGLIAHILLLVLNKCKIGIKAQWFIMLLFLSVYGVFVGLSASVVRASILFLVYLGAKATGKKHDELTALAFAFLLIVVWKPTELFSPGFQLSFSAVSGIILLKSPIEKRLKKGVLQKNKIGISIGEGIATCLAAQIGIVFPMIYWFHQFTLLGILANVIVLPYVSVVLVPLYFSLLILAFVPGISMLLGIVAGGLTKGLIWVSNRLALLPAMGMKAAMPNVWLIAA
ncbi:MAG: ComEC family competence protein, partial [Clostridiales bacterium]|nr:ComEC family competence protein [Clostridiales bacterium]